jgi:phosphoserine phosphatase
MDSTMIRQECIDELADFVGLKDKVSAITERAMRGEIEFEPALRERVALLRGLEHKIVERVLDERIVLTRGGLALVQTMRANGAHTVLVSGGFTVFTEKIAAAIGFHETRANVLMIDGEFFAGTVNEPILGREAKVATLIELRSKLGLNRAETMAIGDGANDLAMLQEAGLGIAYHAKPVVAAAAHARVEHCDLTALLYAQGYRRSELTEDSSPG